MHNKGSMTQEGQESKGKTVGNRHEEICGRERDWAGVHRVNKMDTTGTFWKESREFEGGGFGVD